MAKKLKIVLAQLDITVGDIEGNLIKAINAANTARDNLAADLIVFPELTLTGYPPEDLLLRSAFLQDEADALAKFKAEVKNIHALICHTHTNSQGLLNSCSLIYNGVTLARYAKQELPNDSVFDEYRYFTPANSPCVIPINGVPVGIIICEDSWHFGPAEQAAKGGARIIICPNASPFEINKHEQRLESLKKRVKSTNLPFVYVNSVGAQDELVFDGGSMVIDQDGEIADFAGFCNEILLPVEFQVTSTETIVTKKQFKLPSEHERVYQALVMGVRDYTQKNNFPGILVGVSGGIDSALVLAIATDALGKDKVKGVLMPSRYTLDISMEDSLALIKNLDVDHEIISIEPSFKCFLETLAPSFTGKSADLTEENLQARCRGIIIMALSNKFGQLVLTTGNRSEMAVGYATLYGDMAGGLAVLKDVPKTLVYELANYRNAISPVIPQRIIDRPPTAELAEDQKDEDSLPPYSVLDKILELYLNHAKSIEDIIAQGFDAATVTRIAQLIKRSEYKRRQSPIGIRISKTAFGRDRRYPITSLWKG